jgi:hypothetical protein
MVAALALVAAARHASAETAGACVGDCNGDGVVSINELIIAVNIDLGTAEASACPAFNCDCGHGPPPAICCGIQAVNNLLYGCE